MMLRNPMNGGEVIVDYLVREKVPYVFGLCGHGIISFMDALYDRHEIKTISVHHETVAGSPPDGHTLLLAENAIVIRPGFKDQTPPFDPVTQLDAVASVAYSPLALCLSNRVAANSVRELIELSQRARKKLDYASAGVGYRNAGQDDGSSDGCLGGAA